MTFNDLRMQAVDRILSGSVGPAELQKTAEMLLTLSYAYMVAASKVEEAAKAKEKADV